MRSTEELVKAAQAGEISAFVELVRLYERAAIVTAQAVLRDFHAAQDAAQDAFITAYRKIGQLRDAASFGPWILTIVQRHAGAMRQKTRTAPIARECVATAAASESDWLAAYEEVIEQISRLPEQERVVVVLRYVDGHTVGEIARLTGKPLGTVTKQLSRGIQRLRTWLLEAPP
jgi:RNA polymerase sigma-70 factor (ECF subfamily)